MPSYSRKVQIPGTNSQELYDKVSADVDRFLTKASIGKYEVERDPSRKELKIKSSLFSATLQCAESEMELKAQLSLLAMPFRSKFDDGFDRWLSKTFNLTVTS
jgi:hypothetical protein